MPQFLNVRLKTEMQEPTHSEIIQAGFSRDLPGEFFPTLIIESEENIKIQLLQPQPVYEKAEELCGQWIRSVSGTFRDEANWSMAYLSGRNSVVAQTSGGEHFSGVVDWSSLVIRWSLRK